MGLKASLGAVANSRTFTLPRIGFLFTVCPARILFSIDIAAQLLRMLESGGKLSVTTVPAFSQFLTGVLSSLIPVVFIRT